MPKRIIFISLAIILAAAAGLTVFLLRDGVEPATDQINIPTFPEVSDRPGIGPSGRPRGGEDGIGVFAPSQETADGLVFKQITDFAVVGPIALGRLSDLDLRVRFIERATGHLWEYFPATGESGRLTNTTIPGIQRVWWSKDGGRLVVSYLEGSGREPKYFSARLVKSTTTLGRSPTGEAAEGRLEGSFLPDGVFDLAFDPAGTSRLATLNKSAGSTFARLTDFSGKTIQSIFSLPLEELTISWPSTGTLLVNTLPSASSPGFLWSLNPSKLPKIADESVLKKIISGVNGLTALGNPTGDKILYSQSVSGQIKTFVLDLIKNTSQEFPLNTLPEKCLWSGLEKNIVYCAAPNQLPEADYPDDWYQGQVSFSDTIWEINLEFNDGFALFIPETDAGIKIDATDLTLSADGQYLFFKNKTDGRLWSLRVKKESVF